MTNLDTSVIDDTTQAETPAPTDGGQETGIEATENTEAPAAEPVPDPEPIDYLDTSEIGDRMVKLTIDGEEVDVPLNEALKGYNSNAAATKRFQEAAKMREEAADALNLARAVQGDPGLTMRVLASQQGLTVEQFLNLTPAQQEAVAQKEPEPEFSDPLERALYEERKAREQLEQRISQQEQYYERQQADTALQQAIGGLKNQFGAAEEDVKEVVAQAYQLGVGIESFPMIYQSQQYQKLQARTQAQQDVQSSQQAQEQARRQAAAQASQVVGTGSGATGTAPQQVVRPMSAEEAVRSALEQYGVD